MKRFRAKSTDEDVMAERQGWIVVSTEPIAGGQ